MKSAQLASEAMAETQDEIITSSILAKSAPACDEELNKGLEKPKGLPVLPREILKQIVTYAMTAKNNECYMRCLKPGRYNYSKVNTACFVLDRDLYHIAREAFYTQNTFIFNNFGTEILKVAHSVGPWVCRQERCLYGGDSPIIDRAVFNLGCDINPERSLIQVGAFAVILENLTRPLHVNTLTINIAAYCWRCDDQLQAFCKVLGNVKVLEMLVVTGLDVHLELCVRQLPKALGLDVQPVEWKVKFRTADWQDMGYFISVYVPVVKSPSDSAEGANLIDEAVINDPIAKYREWLKTARQDEVVNGLDYVTDYSNSL